MLYANADLGSTDATSFAIFLGKSPLLYAGIKISKEVTIVNTRASFNGRLITIREFLRVE
jgi:hypothetical protein